MASVELRPGDTLNIVWTSVQDTPLGKREVESSFAFSYDELLTRLRSKGRGGRSRRSGSEGARFRRIVALSVNALRKGKWSTGAEIDKDVVFSKMIKKFRELDKVEYGNITSNAKASLVTIYKGNKALKAAQRKDLKEAVDALGMGEQI